MHEMAIVSGLFEIIDRQVVKHNLQKVSLVRLKVGDLTAIEPMTLTACFEVFAEGTVVEGAELSIERIPITGRCSECDLEFEIKNYDFRCPNCTGAKIEMLSGKELYIDSLDAETQGE